MQLPHTSISLIFVAQTTHRIYLMFPLFETLSNQASVPSSTAEFIRVIIDLDEEARLRKEKLGSL